MILAKQLIALGCAAALFTCALTGCAGANGQAGSLPETAAPGASPSSSVTAGEAKAMIRVGALQGPTGIGMARLMETNDNRESANIYEFTIAGAPDELSGKIVSGELDIVAVPTNLAAVLYGKTEGKVKIVAVNTLGVLYILQRFPAEEEGDFEEITSFQDLAGKTVYATGQGSVPEYVLNFLLDKNGVADADVSFKSEHAELATLMLEGSAKIAMLPQPFVTTVTMKDDSVKTVLDITKEWEAVTDGAQLTMGCLIVRGDFLEKNKGAVDRFLEEYAASTAYANNNINETAALAGQYEIIAEQVARQAIPDCNIVCLTGNEMKDSVAPFLEVLFEADPKSVGGSLPDDAFYYIP